MQKLICGDHVKAILIHDTSASAIWGHTRAVNLLVPVWLRISIEWWALRIWHVIKWAIMHPSRKRGANTNIEAEFLRLLLWVSLGWVSLGLVLLQNTIQGVRRLGNYSYLSPTRGSHA